MSTERGKDEAKKNSTRCNSFAIAVASLTIARTKGGKKVHFTSKIKKTFVFRVSVCLCVIE